MKSEPSECSVQSVLAMPDRRVDWFGIRNYQARNFMRDEMSVDDKVLFYHSSCKEPGIAGLARVASTAHPDETQFDPNSDYYDPKSTRENPRWVCVDIEVLEAVSVIGIAELRKYPELAQMQILKKGNRLSITPLTEQEYRFIIRLIRKDS
ncbi:MAG: EVE domain-containing protein [Burkholderiaceae bacterium]|nr:EVE domain-containing protein [Burkholderiaceae bacterium]